MPLGPFQDPRLRSPLGFSSLLNFKPQILDLVMAGVWAMEQFWNQVFASLQSREILLWDPALKGSQGTQPPTATNAAASAALSWATLQEFVFLASFPLLARAGSLCSDELSEGEYTLI